MHRCGSASSPEESVCGSARFTFPPLGRAFSSQKTALPSHDPQPTRHGWTTPGNASSALLRHYSSPPSPIPLCRTQFLLVFRWRSGRASFGGETPSRRRGETLSQWGGGTPSQRTRTQLPARRNARKDPEVRQSPEKCTWVRHLALSNAYGRPQGHVSPHLMAPQF